MKASLRGKFMVLRTHIKKIGVCQAVVAHTFNPSNWEAEVGESLSLRAAWSTKQVPGQSDQLHREILSRKIKTNKQKNKKIKAILY